MNDRRCQFNRLAALDFESVSVSSGWVVSWYAVRLLAEPGF